jgi:hypothetical protein
MLTSLTHPYNDKWSLDFPFRPSEWVYFGWAGQLWDAIEQHEEERQYCEVLADRLGVAFAHRKIGECHFDLGEYSKALRHQKLHLQIAEEEKSDVEQQRALATIGEYFDSQILARYVHVL